MANLFFAGPNRLRFAWRISPVQHGIIFVCHSKSIPFAVSFDIHKEYLPTRSAPAIEAKVQENAVKVETAKFVKELVVLPQRSGRLKWCPAEDALLESGIKMHGKNFEQIKAIYLPDRTVKALNVRAHKMFHDLVSKSPCF